MSRKLLELVASLAADLWRYAALVGWLSLRLHQTAVVVVLACIGNGANNRGRVSVLTMLIQAEKTDIFAGLKAASESVAILLSVLIASQVLLPNLAIRGTFAMIAVNIVLGLVLRLRFVPCAEANEVAPMLTRARVGKVAPFGRLWA